jgi:hypothetical protein
MNIIIIKDYLVSKVNFDTILVFFLKKTLKFLIVSVIGIDLSFDLVHITDDMSISDQTINVKQEPGDNPDLNNIPFHDDQGVGGSGSPGPSGNNDNIAYSSENVKKEEDAE